MRFSFFEKENKCLSLCVFCSHWLVIGSNNRSFVSLSSLRKEKGAAAETINGAGHFSKNTCWSVITPLTNSEKWNGNKVSVFKKRKGYYFFRGRTPCSLWLLLVLMHTNLTTPWLVLARIWEPNLFLTKEVQESLKYVSLLQQIYC